MIREELLRVLWQTLLVGTAEQRRAPCSGVFTGHYLILCSALSSPPCWKHLSDTISYFPRY